MVEVGADLLVLARAVRPAELDSIRAQNGFTNLAGLECKYFSTSVEGAKTYARMAHARFADGPYKIVVTAIDRHLLDATSRVLVDGGIQVVTVPTDLTLYSSPAEDPRR